MSNKESAARYAERVLGQMRTALQLELIEDLSWQHESPLTALDVAHARLVTGLHGEAPEHNGPSSTGHSFRRGSHYA